MLDGPQARAKVRAICTAFMDVGLISADTRMPPARGRGALLAWEWFVANQLLRLAQARRETAHRRAVQWGVMFDHTCHPRPIGADEVIYDSDLVRIRVAVDVPRTEVDTKALADDLEGWGVSRALINRLILKHTKESAPRHKFTGALVASDGTLHAI